MKEVLEFGIPDTWRMYMTITRFIPANETPNKIVNFCRELEGIESEHGSLDVIGISKKSTKKSSIKETRSSCSPAKAQFQEMLS